MKKHRNITESLGTLYHPKSALVIYESNAHSSNTYVEHFDMDPYGNPINARPLSVREANRLALSLTTDDEQSFLQVNGVLPSNILHMGCKGNESRVLWYTKEQKRQIFFSVASGVSSGKAYVPSMIWSASKDSLSVFAMKGNRRPKESTVLYHAPFLNTYENGRVCMGTVNVNFQGSGSVQEFTQAWEDYYFNSYFSHQIGGQRGRNGDVKSLWKRLLETGEKFPNELLYKNNRTLKDLL